MPTVSLIVGQGYMVVLIAHASSTLPWLSLFSEAGIGLTIYSLLRKSLVAEHFISVSCTVWHFPFKMEGLPPTLQVILFVLSYLFPVSMN